MRIPKRHIRFVNTRPKPSVGIDDRLPDSRAALGMVYALNDDVTMAVDVTDTYHFCDHLGRSITVEANTPGGVDRCRFFDIRELPSGMYERNFTGLKLPILRVPRGKPSPQPPVVHTFYDRSLAHNEMVILLWDDYVHSSFIRTMCELFDPRNIYIQRMQD